MSAPPTDEPSRIRIDIDHAERALDEERVRAAVQRVLDGEEREAEFIGVVLTDHETVRDLNVRYLQHDYDTDVLSFPLSEAGPIEGEIYVDLDTAAERAGEFSTTYEREALRYVIHGLLHLAGYDDSTAEGKAEMRALEETYLAKN
ncbi:MAG: rRNA maturation RNase YbeY [Bacteroidota bacterium]